MPAIPRSTPCLDVAVALEAFHKEFTLSHANGIDEVAETGALLEEFLDLRHALQSRQYNARGAWACLAGTHSFHCIVGGHCDNLCLIIQCDSQSSPGHLLSNHIVHVHRRTINLKLEHDDERGSSPTLTGAQHVTRLD